MEIVKEGWLWRQTFVMKEWELNWGELTIDGRLLFYKTENKETLAYTTSLLLVCDYVCCGEECEDFSPPDNLARETRIVVTYRDGLKLNMCAMNEEEAGDWMDVIHHYRRRPGMPIPPGGYLYFAPQAVAYYMSNPAVAAQILHEVNAEAARAGLAAANGDVVNRNESEAELDGDAAAPDGDRVEAFEDADDGGVQDFGIRNVNIFGNTNCPTLMWVGLLLGIIVGQILYRLIER